MHIYRKFELYFCNKNKLAIAWERGSGLPFFVQNLNFYLPKVILNENSCEWNWKSITRNKQVVQIFHAQDYDKKSVLHV